MVRGRRRVCISELRRYQDLVANHEQAKITVHRMPVDIHIMYVHRL